MTWSGGINRPRFSVAHDVRYWHKADMLVALHMSAFGGKADIAFALHMSAYDPKRTFGGLYLSTPFKWVS